MRLNLAYFILTWTISVHARPPGHESSHGPEPPCRFVEKYPQAEVVHNPSKFVSDMLYWEGKFHQNEVSYNSANGMSYDGTNLNYTTGERTDKHPFSAASKESLQVMIYAHAVSGSKEAARFLSPEEPSAAPAIAASIMRTKLETYLQFNETFPGFGGFLPWFTSSTKDITPTYDWVNRVPGLDNGELLWAVYAFVQGLENTGKPSYLKLARDWQNWLDYAKTNAVKIFYKGNGQVCAVTSINNQSLPANDPKQTYTCEGSGRLNDPYEGELFTFFLDFFGGLSDHDVDQLWKVKRPQLQAVDYDMDGVGPITVQKGYWFSSHEQWKVLELPYYDVDIIRRVYKNAERVRTCNSVVTKTPGMYASVNNITDPSTGKVLGYISNAGIPSVAFITDQELDVITPYSVFPTVLFDRDVGLAWWRDMVAGKKMQNPYGSTESTRVDGTGISALVTWDSKMTTVNAILGGVGDLVRQKMKTDGIYEKFFHRAKKEYSRVFNDLKGEDVDFCLPAENVPDAGLTDFTQCHGVK